MQRIAVTGLLTLLGVGAMLAAAEAMATEYFPKPRDFGVIVETMEHRRFRPATPIPWPREFLPHRGNENEARR